MFRSRRPRVHRDLPEDLRRAIGVFGQTIEVLEWGKASLISAAPRGRGPGRPLAEALLGFEQSVKDAEALLPEWNVEPLGDAWRGCRSALAEAARRAEALRLGEPPDGYERLYGMLGDLLEPLEAFGIAADRLRAMR